MSRKIIPILCYWDGRISHGSQGITYEGAIPKAIKVDRGLKHDELIDKICKLIGIDCQQYKLKIICRYLANGQYIPLQIDSDESVEIMLDMTKEKGINCVELYIEKSSAAAGDEGDEPIVTRDPSLYIHLNIKTQTGKEILLRMMRDSPMEKLMNAFCQREQTPLDMCRFIWAGRQLEHMRTPNEYRMVDGSIIHVVYRLRGD